MPKRWGGGVGVEAEITHSHSHPMNGWAAVSSQENSGTLKGACTSQRLKLKYPQVESVSALELLLG